MPVFTICIQHQQTLVQTRAYAIEAASEDEAREKGEAAWDAYNSGETRDDLLHIDGKRFTPPDAEEIMDAEANVWVVDAEDEAAGNVPLVEQPHDD